MFWTYVIQSISIGKVYIGHTSNLEAAKTRKIIIGSAAVVVTVITTMFALKSVRVTVNDNTIGLAIDL